MLAVLPSLVREGKMSDKLDDIDIALLQQCEQKPCQSVATIISPLLGTRKERTLYDRIVALEEKKLIAIDRTQKTLACVRLTEQGKAAIMGRADPTPQKEADLP
jgi:hypothetical protein